jgi:hypothetical protein
MITWFFSLIITKCSLDSPQHPLQNSIMHEFQLVFEYIDGSVFKTINHIRHHLDVVCKGKYNLSIEFNNKQNKLANMYQLRGAPALVNTANKQVIYGSVVSRKEIKGILSEENIDQ